MISLDVGIFVGTLRGTDVGHHPQGQQKAHQRRGKIAPAAAADPAGVAIEGKHAWPSRGPQERQDGLEGRLLPKGLMHLGRQQDRGPRIHKVTDFDHMLSFAFPIGISRDRGGVFEIHLHFLQWVARLQRLMLTWDAWLDVAVLAQEFPHGPTRARHRDTQRLQVGVTLQEIHERFGTRDPLQLLWRLFAHLAQPLDHRQIPAVIGGMMGARTRQEHLEIISRGLAQTDFPFLHPADGASHGLSILWVRPVGMLTHEAAQTGAIADPLGFHA